MKNRMAVFAGVGFELIALLLSGAFLGQYLEKRFPSQGFLTAGLVILALVGWMVHLIVLLRRMDENSPDQK